jgi:dihydroflavonol-4-reductase
VKNVAEMHVNAIKMDASKNQRFLASSETMSFIEIAQVIKAAYPNRKVNLTKAPNFIIRILGLFDGDIKRVVPILGKRNLINNNRAQKVLKIKFISAKQSILETAEYLIKNGFVKN